MKRDVLKTASFCDACGKEYPYPQKCKRCGKEFCFDCNKVCGVDYRHGVHFSGSGDGYYCTECDIGLKRSGSDKLHSAYLKIKTLRHEEKLFWEDFKERTEIAEAEIKRLTE